MYPSGRLRALSNCHSHYNIMLLYYETSRSVNEKQEKGRTQPVHCSRLRPLRLSPARGKIKKTGKRQRSIFYGQYIAALLLRPLFRALH